MATLGVLHIPIAAQLESAADERRYLDPVCVAQHLDELQEQLRLHKPQALILDLTSLGPEPRPTIERLLESSGAELCLVIYSYARRRDLEALEAPHIKLLKTPVSLSMLRSSMLSLISREVFSNKAERASSAALDAPLPVSMNRQITRQLEPIGAPLVRAISSLEAVHHGASELSPDQRGPATDRLIEEAGKAHAALSHHARALYLLEMERR